MPPRLPDPPWLARLRPAAAQRPRTQLVRIRWHDLQELIRERDALLADADEAAVARIAVHHEHQFGRDHG
jgi:hypothetical protein